MENIELRFAPSDGDIHRFTIKNVNVSIINGLRRIILTDIPTVIFKTFPHKENNAEFHINTTRLNNEILKQRLGCIPISIDDLETPLDNLIVEIWKKNETNSIQYITTEDFKIKNIVSNKYLSASVREKIFPKNKKTKDYILFARLRPKISEHILGEELKITAKMSIGHAKESGMYNVVSTCSYGMTPDKTLQQQMWSETEQKLSKLEVTKQEISEKKQNWENHTAKRYYKDDSFDFSIETVGVFTNQYILEKACDILIEKLNIREFTIIESLSTMKHCYDFTLINEDYTIGRIIEYILNARYYHKKKILSFVGFRKKHPHDTNSIIRIAFKNETSQEQVAQLLKTVCEQGIAIYKIIKSKIQ